MFYSNCIGSTSRSEGLYGRQINPTPKQQQKGELIRDGITGELPVPEAYYQRAAHISLSLMASERLMTLQRPTNKLYRLPTLPINPKRQQRMGELTRDVVAGALLASWAP